MRTPEAKVTEMPPPTPARSAAEELESSAPWEATMDTPVLAEPRARSRVLYTLKRDERVFGNYITDPANNAEWLQVQPNPADAPGYIARSALVRVHPANRVEGNLTIGQEAVNRWWGLPLEYAPSDLVELPPRIRARSGKLQLRRESASALLAMLDAAAAEGVSIKAISAYRSGGIQQRLYNDAIRRAGPGQRFSAPPGHSEHQLGTTVDLVDPANNAADPLTEAFAATSQSRWLEQNAARFGFRRSYYPSNVAETGYISEPWHWRYIGRP